MKGYIPASRFLVAVVVVFLVWTDFPTRTGQAGAAVSQPSSSARAALVTNRGGPRPPSPPTPGMDVLTIRPQAVVPSPTPTSPPGSPDSPDQKPQPILRLLGQFQVTGYSDSPINGTDGRGITRSGQRTRWGVVAVDPRIIPLGTELVIEDMDGTVFTALDTGGGVLGHWVDVWYPSDWEARQHGVRQLKVYMVER